MPRHRTLDLHRLVVPLVAGALLQSRLGQGAAIVVARLAVWRDRGGPGGGSPN